MEIVEGFLTENNKEPMTAKIYGIPTSYSFYLHLQQSPKCREQKRLLRVSSTEFKPVARVSCLAKRMIVFFFEW
jgi:hypothetical protein